MIGEQLRTLRTANKMTQKELAGEIASLEDEKTALAAQLDEIRKAEKKAKEAAELKRLLKLMHKKDISVEDLEAMISREA